MIRISLAALMLTFPCAALAQNAEITTLPPKEIQVSYNQSVNLPMALKFLQEKYKFSYICDLVPGDNTWRFPVEIKEMTLRQSLEYLCRIFRRSMFNVNGILVFRSVEWYKFDGSEGLSTEIKPEITLLPELTSALNPPARLVRAAGFSCSLGKLTQEISTASRWKISVSSEIERRKICIQTEMVSPGTISEAISVLVNAQQTISIYKTKDQRDKELMLATMRPISPREKISQELRPELEKLLTSEQKKKMLSEEVPIKISSLKEPLKSKVLNYVKFLANRPNQSVNIDLSKINQFEIVFLPPGNAPGGALGVNGWLEGGGAVGF